MVTFTKNLHQTGTENLTQTGTIIATEIIKTKMEVTTDLAIMLEQTPITSQGENQTTTVMAETIRAEANVET